MQNWIALIRFGEGAKYAAIADALAGAIRSGDMRPGARLPAQRDLAESLGVDLTTVTRAYGLLREAGLIEGAGKLGSFVRHDVAPPRFGETASDMGMNVPPQPAFNLLPEAIRTGTAALLRAARHSPILQYQPSLGNKADREQAAASLRMRGIAASSDQVAILAGAQHALHAIVSLLPRRGNTICCAPFVYPGLLMLARRFGLPLSPVAADEEGMLPEALEAALRAGGRTIYLTPTNDNPTTAMMSAGRREAIVATARRHGAVIIEDDAYGPLASDAPLPCAALGPELCWHIAGTSKLITPALRIAHVCAPSAAQAERLAADIGETATMAPPLNAALVSLWQRDGTFDALVAGVRAESVVRQRLAARLLAGFPRRAHPEGYHLWLDTGGRIKPDALVAAVAPLGLSIVAGDVFDASGAAGTRHVRVSVGGAIDHAGLERALRRLADLLGGGSA